MFEKAAGNIGQKKIESKETRIRLQRGYNPRSRQWEGRRRIGRNVSKG